MHLRKPGVDHIQRRAPNAPNRPVLSSRLPLIATGVVVPCCSLLPRGAGWEEVEEAYKEYLDEISGAGGGGA